MENAVKLRFRRVVYKFGLIWFLVNFSIVSIGLYLSHQIQYNDLLSVPAMLILIGLVLGLSQGMLIRKHFQAFFRRFKLGGWVASLLIGLTLTFLTALASMIVSILPGLSQLGRLGSSVPPPPDIASVVESFTLLSKYLFVVGSVLGGGITGLFQFAMIRKYVKSAVLWIVATTLSAGLNGLIYYSSVQSGLFNEFNRPYDPNYDSVAAVTSGKIGVVYGFITGVAMMIMLYRTIEHQTRSQAQSS
ncbi:hypothetical protein [Leptolyngbya sp. NIES-2104]|uniref:hypothetical protein n=1 Tax=Leptolyngbya sp. NIES-2104 TaxID=1552121 RepID=UPI0006EC9663|nr:hypothetical protein [Leptolyngbya sp. NIES-2104]GAP95836.1 hypothetical protein NIES2104_23620 [Leptolyngbya sp. NIES-2104]